jgi:hypothetical protein
MPLLYVLLKADCRKSTRLSQSASEILERLEARPHETLLTAGETAGGIRRSYR